MLQNVQVAPEENPAGKIYQMISTGPFVPASDLGPAYSYTFMGHGQDSLLLAKMHSADPVLRAEAKLAAIEHLKSFCEQELTQIEARLCHVVETIKTAYLQHGLTFETAEEF